MWWTPDLSQRSETAGRWPRLATGENTTPIWQLDGSLRCTGTPSVPKLAAKLSRLGYYSTAPPLEEQRAAGGQTYGTARTLTEEKWPETGGPGGERV